MKKHISMLLILLMTFAFAGDKVVFEKSLKVKSGGVLKIDLETGGDLNISTWGEMNISVTAKASEWNNKNKLEIEFSKSGRGAILESFSGKHLTYYISLPRKFNLDLLSMSGDFKISDLEGTIKGRTNGGSMVLNNLKGQISMTTMGGSISLKNSTLEGSVSTMGGRVHMENVSGGVKGSSMGGEVIRKNVEGSGGKMTGGLVDISTMGGSINVDDAPEGADVHTMGGEIHIKRAKKFVKAKTMGGNITIDEVEGWVKATTMGGEIKVTMVGKGKKGAGDIELTSMHGDITLVIPKEYSMSFNLEVINHKNSSDQGKIVSDFDLGIEKEAEWQGNVRKGYKKSIFCKGKVGSGKNMITIKTHNSDIIIKQK